jgi:hypothetical protein
VTQPPQLPQFALLEHIVRVLKDTPPVRAAFLRGSFHHGRPDVYSNLDLFVVADDADAEALLTLGQGVLHAVGQTQWISLDDTNPPRLRALFPGPLRLDMTLVTAATMPPYAGWRILFDRDNWLRTRAAPAAGGEPLLPEHVLCVCDEFWWSMFNSVGQLKRGHLWLALNMLDTCRANLAQMMRWRRDRERPSERFADLERHLTAEDQQALAQTLASYDLRAIAEALLGAADAFDPAARDVAARVGAEYPAPLAHETKAFFIREFWALLAPGPTISA